MPDARRTGEWDEITLLTEAGVSAGEVWQLPDGRAAVYPSTSLAAGTGTRQRFETSGKFTFTKATGFAMLRGGRAYWDHSANNVSYKKVNDRDFYLGRVETDVVSADSTVVLNINIDPRYDIDLINDPYRSALVGTVSVTGCNIFRRGGTLNFVHNATSEAQKLDALSVDGFSVLTNAIMEFVFTVINDGAGTNTDVNFGASNGTNATDFDSVTQFIGFHLNGNSVNIYAESRDGTSTPIAETDTTIDYTEGAGIANRVEAWIDMRDPAACVLYLNGARVLSGSTFDVDSSGTLQLVVHSEKTSSADVYEFDIERANVRFMEQ